MNIKVTTTKVEIDNASLNKGEYNIRECNFELAEEFTGLVCKALFTISKTKLTYEQSIVNGKCNIPYEATLNRGKVTIGVIGYEVENEELIKRYSPEPDEFFVLDGSYVEDIENQSTPTPSDLEQLEQRVSAIEIDAEQVEINTQNISDLQENKADKTELEDFITKDVNDLTYYTLTTQTGSQIELSLNSSNFKMTATLKDKNGTVVNTSNEIDLPLESVVVNASYDSTTKEIILTLQNGNTVRFSVADLVSGLQTEITSSNKLSSDLVDDTNHTNKFVTANEKIQITTNKNNITSLSTNKEDKSSLVTGTGTEVTLSKTAELEFIQPPLPRGNSEQVQYSGKNKLPFTNQDFTVNGVRYYVQNGILYLDGTSSGETSTNNGNFKNNFSFTLESGTYVFSRLITTIPFKISKKSNDEELMLISGTTEVKTFTLTETTEVYLGIYVYNKTFNNQPFLIQLEQGSTATSYEPYVGGTASPNPSYPQAITNVTGDVEVVVQNKNIFDVTEFEENIVENRIINDSGVIVVDNTSEYSTYKIPVKANEQLHISGWLQRVYLFDTNDNFISRTTYYDAISTTVKPSFDFIPTVDGYIEFQIYISHYNDRKGAEQVEYGSTATTYTPHQEQTYTFPLGNQRMYLGDYLADDGIHHVSKQIELDGSNDEEWQRNGTTQGYSVLADNVGGTANTSVIPKILCNKLIAVKQSAIYGGTANNGISSQSDTQRIYVRINETITTVELLKQWLAENPITVEYELATEEITPYTTEQQQAYNEIKQAFSYEEQTNISGSSDESNPLFSVKAVQYKEPDYWTIAYVNGQIGNAIGGAY